ncbi:MAG TPA: DUF4389 domain-containing protein [Acidimicrobiales bacterium]|nr:DUF4389 domain-containing protein [Acidimicrobiales bacterium]
MTRNEPEPESPSGSLAGTAVLLVTGAIVALVGLVSVSVGGVLLWAHTTQRDADGFYTTGAERYATTTYALTAQVDLGEEGAADRGGSIDNPLGTVRLRVAGGEAPLFVGIGRRGDVDRWLSGVRHERVTGPALGPLDSATTVVGGDRTPTSPLDQAFWVAATAGSGRQTLVWPSEGGRWTVVVMNADARPEVSARVTLGVRTRVLLPVGSGIGAFGVTLLALASVLFFLALRNQTAGPEPAARPGRPGTYPVRLDGHLDPGLSRWLWLVKWVLVIPHAVVLAFLWLAVSMLTVVAGVAILLTGRYPRSIFDFNVGVMRWTWRVAFYGFSALATDRYPPFSLRPDPGYPAEFSVDYPERLSRGLVLVKWWLLALPHYLVVAVFAGGWGVGWTGGSRIAGGGGLIALLALVGAVVLLVKRHYPEEVFDFLMGLNRWCYRVLAYAALMRDEYPPFRLDAGGLDPGSVPVVPGPAAPDRSGELVDTTA